MSGKSDGDKTPEVTPSKLARIFERIHGAAQTNRAIANTAVGRRIKARQAKDEKKDKGK